MNENERMAGQADLGSEILKSSPQKSVEKAKSPLRIVGILTTPLKTFDQLRAESPLRNLVENPSAVDFKRVDDSTQKNMENPKKFDVSTLKQYESQKNVEFLPLNNSKNVEISTLKHNGSSKNVEFLPLNNSKDVEISALKHNESSKNVDFSTLISSKKVEIPTFKSYEVPKSVDNGAFVAFEKPTLKALVTRKLLEYTKLPGTFDKHPLINNEARLKGDALLKSLLSASTALSQKMITTTEVTDENLNLRKILYQADKAKCDERELDSSLPSANNDEDETRLVIDIPEEMNNKASKKSMPSLESFEDENKNVSKLLRPTTLDTAFVSTRPLLRQPTPAQDRELFSAVITSACSVCSFVSSVKRKTQKQTFVDASKLRAKTFYLHFKDVLNSSKANATNEIKS